MIAFPDCRLCAQECACRASVIDCGPFLRDTCNGQSSRGGPLAARILAAVATGEALDCNEIGRRIGATGQVVRVAVCRQVARGHMVRLSGAHGRQGALYAVTHG